MSASSTAGRTPILWWVQTGLLVLLAAHLVISVWSRDGFTWMDPTQYYDAACKVAAEGIDGMAGFLVASSYPLLLGSWLKISHSIPFALCSNVIWLTVLALALSRLCRRVGLSGWAPAVLLAVMTAPAIFGLSRELYLEFPLTALVALHYAVWFERDQSTSRWYWPLFGALMLLGFSIKMTYPIFLVAPMSVEVVMAVRARRGRRLLALGSCLVLPPLAVLFISKLLFPDSFPYYLSLGNTTMPPMRLIGPPEALSVSALLFYVDQLGRNYLCLLSPVVLLFIWRAWPRLRDRDGSRDRLDLWLWLLFPIVCFTLFPVREPRHIAPCVVPLLLLTLLGGLTLSPPKRRLAIVSVGLLGFLQYVLVSIHVIAAPYLLDQAMRWPELEKVLQQTTPDTPAYINKDGQLDGLRWRYTRNLLLSGFRPNEALSLAWSANLGIVMDLDAFEESRRLLPQGYRVFTDLYLLSAFNLYNHRCGWSGYYETLSRTEALASADALLVVLPRNQPVPCPPGFHLAASVDWDRGAQVGVYLPDTPPAKSFRRIYAEKFLSRNLSASPGALRAIFQDLLLDAVLRRQFDALTDVRALFPPGFTALGPMDQIYFLKDYRELLDRLTDPSSAGADRSAVHTAEGIPGPVDK